MPKLCALVAYYPHKLSNPANGFPPSLSVCVHLAGLQPMGAKYKPFVYPNVEPGFAESGLDEYDRISADLAWTRTLGLVRKAHEMG